MASDAKNVSIWWRHHGNQVTLDIRKSKMGQGSLTDLKNANAYALITKCDIHGNYENNITAYHIRAYIGNHLIFHFHNIHDVTFLEQWLGMCPGAYSGNAPYSFILHDIQLIQARYINANPHMMAMV